MTPVDGAVRRRARAAALQMLYQGEIGRTGPQDAIATYWPSRDPDETLPDDAREFANGIVRGTTSRIEEIDRLLGAHAQNWRVARMAVIDRLVLRMATYELLADAETPTKVVINEAIELARAYSGDEAVGFVNGVLDAVRRELGRE
jgi:N utilization substance protein B